MGDWVAEILKWSVILIIAWMYRKGIGTALASLATRSIKAGSIELGASPQAAKQATPEAIGETSTALTIGEIADPVVLEQATMIKNMVESRPESERMQYLIKESATFVVASYFYQIYSLIYGSQLNALWGLNQSPATGLDAANMRAASYEPAVARDPAFYASYQFEKWLGFMKDTLLITEQGGRYYITPRGRAFLQFLVTNSLSVNGITNNAWH
jgi:hypothetical protein